jgi:hypothetical protein
MKVGSKLLVVGLGALVCISNVIGSLEGVDAKNPTGWFKIKARKKDDAIDVQGGKDKTILVVKSPSGISNAVIERQTESWPKSVVLRLHLKGLESFQASNGKLKLNAAASIRDGKPNLRQWKDGKEDAPLDQKSPLWIGLRILDGDGIAVRRLPLNDGHFEITLPEAFFDGNPTSITVSWIDFYR